MLWFILTVNLLVLELLQYELTVTCQSHCQHLFTAFSTLFYTSNLANFDISRKLKYYSMNDMIVYN